MAIGNKIRDYTAVTETPGDRITQEAFQMMYTRYAFAASLCSGKHVLEVACGAGQGLGYLAKAARRVVGGDYTEGLLRRARDHYGGRIPLMRLDAHTLPFRARSFDVVILYEALYYLPRPQRFFEESRRILCDGGALLISTPNPEWPGFHQSPYSVRYFTAQELAELLNDRGFSVELFAAFPAPRDSARDRVVLSIKRMAVLFHLIPKTMRGKEVLKRLFLGPLAEVPPEVTDGMVDRSPLVPIAENSVVRDYKVLYAIGLVR